MEQHPDPARVKRGRLKLALLGAFFVLPMVAAWVIWRFELVPGVVIGTEIE